ncbi:hypothetical protein BDN72DRAFT_902591 [Pluteus cervinus]|uniref:Uncharacterized protein n=1 Tax=Pluteus cervinus TaxID=181527 RepID=A0ACD3ACG8_9AGAR|nr:hypothetical protein BDN72DRAFT_902591 [Pluteus cervinus]
MTNFQGLNEDIVIHILNRSRVIDLVRFGMTSWLHRHLAKPIIKDRVDAGALLKQFFEDDEIPVFRSYLRQTSTIVSGSAALQLLDGKSWDSTNLDLFVQDDSRQWALHCWLRERFKWDALRRRGPSHYFQAKSVKRVLRFERECRGVNQSIHWVVTEHSPIEAILQFNLTCVMNFFTHESAFSLFPVMTFDQRRTFTVGPYSPSIHDFYNTYEYRGWEVVMPPLTDEDWMPPKVRYIGDAHCWKMENIFPTLPPLEEGAAVAIEYMHSFQMIFDPIVSILFCTLEDKQLKHAYSHSPDQHVFKFVKYLLETECTDNSLQINMKNFLDYNMGQRNVDRLAEAVQCDDDEDDLA